MVGIESKNLLKHVFTHVFLAAIDNDTSSPRLNKWNVHHIGVLHQLVRELACFFQLICAEQVLTLKSAMLDADWAVGENVCAVDNGPGVVGVALVSELLKHLKLVNYCGDRVPVFSVSRVVGVKLNCHVEGFLCLRDPAQGQLRLVESLVDTGELAINSDACLAVLDGTSVLPERDEASGPIRENLLSGLNVGCFRVKGDGRPIISSFESFVALGLLSVGRRIYCCFYHVFGCQFAFSFLLYLFVILIVNIE